MNRNTIDRAKVLQEVIADFKKRWCTAETLKKYLNCRDTNLEEFKIEYADAS